MAFVRDVNFAWPTAEITVMGAKGAVEIIFSADAGDADKLAARTKEYQDRLTNPYVAAPRGFIDDVIMSRNTRRRIIRALRTLRTKQLVPPEKARQLSNLAAGGPVSFRPRECPLDLVTVWPVPRNCFGVCRL